jgi:hypothetical protein
VGNLLNSRYRPRSEPKKSLRKRSDVGVVDEPQGWRLVITQGRDHFCEVTVPHEISEWRACVKHCREKKEVWATRPDGVSLLPVALALLAAGRGARRTR